MGVQKVFVEHTGRTEQKFVLMLTRNRNRPVLHSAHGSSVRKNLVKSGYGW